nr:phosphoadenosine phosphosulfate reductase family protein [uncultured Carboxylicivirga sp.]
MRLADNAIKFIRTIAKSTGEPLFSGNSGGKDSAVLEDLLQRSGINYTSQYTNTTIDPKGTIKHIRDYYPHTNILQPKLSFYQLVEKKGLPTRGRRFCCEVLKEYASIGRMNFEGVRSEESNNRANRDYIQCDTRSSMKGAKHLYPIYDWRLNDIYEYIDKYNIPLAPAYSKGLHRLGCVGCPLVRKKGQRVKEFLLYPKYYTAIKKSIQKGMDNNPQWKITCATDGDSELAMHWWLSGDTIEEYFPYTFIKTDIGWKKITSYTQQSLFAKTELKTAL